jgi:hypothetical protein
MLETVHTTMCSRRTSRLTTTSLGLRGNMFVCRLIGANDDGEADIPTIATNRSVALAYHHEGMRMRITVEQPSTISECNSNSYIAIDTRRSACTARQQ